MTARINRTGRPGVIGEQRANAIRARFAGPKALPRCQRSYELVAAELGISPRTVQNHMPRLGLARTTPVPAECFARLLRAWSIPSELLEVVPC